MGEAAVGVKRDEDLRSRRVATDGRLGPGVRSSTAVATTTPHPARLATALATAVLSISSAAVVIRALAGSDPLLVASGRVAITGVFMWLWTPRGTRELALQALTRARLAGLILGSGSLLALHFATWIASLSYTTVLRSVVLVCTQPLFAAVLGIIRGERPSPRFYIGSMVALTGVALIIAPEDIFSNTSEIPTDSSEPLDQAWIGDLLALAGAAAAAGYLAIGRQLEARVQLRPYLALIHTVAALQLGATMLIWQPPLPAELEPPDAATIAWGVLYLGVVPGIFGHGLINYAVRHMPVHTVTLVTMLEPLGASVIAYIALDEAVHPSAGLGAAIVLGGITLGLGARTTSRHHNSQSKSARTRMGRA